MARPLALILVKRERGGEDKKLFQGFRILLLFEAAALEWLPIDNLHR